MSERRSRGKGRGLDAIFDSADLTLAPTRRTPEPNVEEETGDVVVPPVETTEVGERGIPTRSSADYRHAPRAVGRPRGQVSQVRELVQRGFYLEPSQDRMLDEIKAGLKGRGFTPDRSAIARAALAYFGELDPLYQEELVRRHK